MKIEDRLIAVWRRVVRFYERFAGPFFEENGRVITYSEMTPEQRRAFDQVQKEMGRTGEAMMAFGEALLRRKSQRPPSPTGAKDNG